MKTFNPTAETSYSPEDDPEFSDYRPRLTNDTADKVFMDHLEAFQRVTATQYRPPNWIEYQLSCIRWLQYFLDNTFLDL